jgi:hypothetical protein
MKTKRDLIKEIKDTFNSLNSNMSPNIIENRCERIIKCLDELEVLEKGYVGDSILALNRTLSKELLYAEHYEKEMKKQNAAKIRKKEFTTSKIELISRINLDLFNILNEGENN